MKKLLFVLTLILYINTTDVFAQNEVRGIETRIVKYEGERYCYNSYSYNGRWIDEHDNIYHAWELTNFNSIPVSVDLEVWKKGKENNWGILEPDKLQYTKTIVLQPNETYRYAPNGGFWAEHGSNPISNYYLKYKAYKLE